MRRSTVGIVLILALVCLVAPRAAEAQQPTKVHRIGILGLASAATTAFNIEALRQGLRELGYVEGQNLTPEYRWAEGRPERLADLAAELVRLPVDLIVAYANLGVLAAKRATTTLPIVGAIMSDPVEAGLVESLARPGGNITGLFYSWWELQVSAPSGSTFIYCLQPDGTLAATRTHLGRGTTAHATMTRAQP